MAVKLVETDAGVGLAFDDPKRGKPYFVDFLSTSWRSRFAKPLPRNHIFRRALGVGDDVVRVVDATAGFGQDAVTALTLGCEVVALERSKEVARVLRDGVLRAGREEASLKTRFKKLAIVEADALVWLAELKPEAFPDVVYLDPMFDKPKKSAKSPKEMQLLQELLGAAPSADDELKLFEAAWRVAKRRVVVKRALKGRAVKSSPTHSFKGQSIRYDVYVKS